VLDKVAVVEFHLESMELMDMPAFLGALRQTAAMAAMVATGTTRIARVRILAAQAELQAGQHQIQMAKLVEMDIAINQVVHVQLQLELR
jgi:hypothetical protein